LNSRYREKEKDIEPKIGERITSYFIGKYVKARYKMWMFRKEANESELSLQDLSRICSEHVVPVTSPIALISDIQGSGGTLLSLLFDGHPELHVHPHELMFGYPERDIWPKIDLSDGPERWFEVLFEGIVSEYNREGFKKEKEDREIFPFVFISSLQRKIFLDYIDSVQSTKIRDIFNTYMTSYFGAWLNNQNCYGSKKFITAYTSSLGATTENIESFFEIYPDGRFIFVVRDPKSWLAFAQKRWPGSYTDIGQALSVWNERVQTMLLSQKRYGNSVCLIRFEDFVGRTEAVMRFLSEFLSIEFGDILLVPTFNKLPIEVNASLNVRDHGAADSPLSAEKTSTGQELDTIERMTSETYSLVLREAVRFE
jgi:hypothetical protein